MSDRKQMAINLHKVGYAKCINNTKCVSRSNRYFSVGDVATVAATFYNNHANQWRISFKGKAGIYLVRDFVIPTEKEIMMEELK